MTASELYTENNGSTQPHTKNTSFCYDSLQICSLEYSPIFYWENDCWAGMKWSSYKLLQDIIPIFARIEWNGIPIRTSGQGSHLGFFTLALPKYKAEVW